ncbi:hypothetical protein FJR75_11665 [Thermus thermophilus]|nr:hypothetical protein [Thermus thermophilus]
MAFAALYMGSCSGHGAGAGGSWMPGPGGGATTPCSPGNLPSITHLPGPVHDAMATWLPTPLLPLTPLGAARNVFINGIIPIVDQDLLTPHPTLSVYAVTRTVGKCTIVAPANAWWCHTYTGVGTVAGREPPIGHARKAIATTKSVWINGRRACRVGDPLGDLTPAFPCRSLISAGSPNVIIGV